MDEILILKLFFEVVLDVLDVWMFVVVVVVVFCFFVVAVL